MSKHQTPDKYRVVCEEDFKGLKKINARISKSRYRQIFHIQPHTGLLNDPNGFSYINGRWHLFYQWYPFGAIHGMKH